MTGTETGSLVAALGAWIAAWPDGVEPEEIACASQVVLDGSLLFVAADDTKAIELRRLDSETRRVVDKARSWYRNVHTSGPAVHFESGANTRADTSPKSAPAIEQFFEARALDRGQTRRVERVEPARTVRAATGAPNKKQESTVPVRTTPKAAVTRTGPDPTLGGSLPSVGATAAHGARTGRSIRPPGEPPAVRPSRTSAGPTTFAQRSRPIDAAVVVSPAPQHTGAPRAVPAARQWEEPALWVVCAIALVVLAVLQFT